MIRILRLLFTLFLLFFLSLATAAQVSENSDFEIVPIEVDRNNGSAAVDNKLYVSEDGFLWYTTFDGVVKHYGSSSVVFPFGDGINKGIEYYSEILEDKEKNLWIVTDKGLYFFNTKTAQSKLITWVNPETNNAVVIIDIALSVDHNIIATTNSRYVLRVAKDDFNIISFRIPDTYYEVVPALGNVANYYVKIEETRSDQSVVLSQFNKFYQYDNGVVTMLADYSKTRKRGRGQNKFQLIENGSVFEASTSGTYLFEGEQYRYEYLPKINKHLVQFLSQGFNFLSYTKGDKDVNFFCRTNPENLRQLLFYAYDQDRQELVKDERQITFNGIIKDLAGTDSNVFYVSTPQLIYAVRTRDTDFESFLTDAQRLDNTDRVSIRGFTEDEEGTIYAATVQGIYMVKKGSEAVQKVNLSFIEEKEGSLPTVRELFFRDGFLWTIGEDVLLRKIDLENKTFQNFSIQTVRDDPSITMVTLERWGKDKLLLGTTRGLFSFDFGSENMEDLCILNAKNNLSVRTIWDILVEEDGQLVWLATESAGVFSKNYHTGEVNQITVENTNEILGSNVIYKLHRGMDDRLYLGTYGGLSILDTESGEVITNTVDQGLANNIVVGILENENNLWLSTYNGLVGYSKIDDWFYNYYTKDGLPDNEFNRHANFKDRAGNFYFGGLNGFVKFNPDEIVYRKPDAFIEIVSAEFYDTDEQAIVKSTLNVKTRLKNVVLPYDKSFFNVTYAIPNSFDVDAPVFEYKLEGLNSNWMDLGNDRSLRLNGLSPGSYILNIRGKDSSGNPTINMIEIPIVVLEIFYKKNWFIALNLIFFGFIVSVVYRYRRRRWRERLKQQRIVGQLESKALRGQMNPHFIFNTLNGLQSTMILKGERAANEYLGAFSKLLRSTLDMSKSDVISLSEEINYLQAYLQLENLRQARPITTSIIIAPEDMDMDSIFIPCMIFQPLIENAILHGLAPKRDGIPTVTISFKEEDTHLVGIVTDNGIGREAAAVLKATNRKTHKSWATTIMEERIDIINSFTETNVDFYIEDLYEGGQAVGTKVTMKLPIVAEKI